MKKITLDQLEIGKIAYVDQLKIDGSIRRRLLDIGLIPGTEVECVLESPFRDPIAYKIRGALIALRLIDAKKIWMEVQD